MSLYYRVKTGGQYKHVSLLQRENRRSGYICLFIPV